METLQTTETAKAKAAKSGHNVAQHPDKKV
jgi:hypothetical protein